MIVLDKIKTFDEDEMAGFLYMFAHDTIRNFENFMFPDKDKIKEFLEKEIPNTLGDAVERKWGVKPG